MRHSPPPIFNLPLCPHLNFVTSANSRELSKNILWSIIYFNFQPFARSYVHKQVLIISLI